MYTHTYRYRWKKIARYIDRQLDRQIARQIDRQIGQTDIDIQIYMYKECGLKKQTEHQNPKKIRMRKKKLNDT